MKRVNTQLISVILEEFIKEEGLSNGLEKVRVFEAWDLIVGKPAAKATQNKFLSNGVLYCTVTSSILRTQLYYRKDDIIAQINKMLNSTIIKKIVLK